MIIKNFYTLDKIEKNLFVDFLIECAKEHSQPASVNMYDNNWEQKNNTLPYILNKTNRFVDKGSFNVLFNKDEVIACSGCYTSNFSNEIAICGSRTWIKESYRNKQIARDYLLPYEKEWAIKNKHKCILLTFNDYNKNLIALWSRKRLGEHRKQRQPNHFGYNGINVLEYPVTINYTKQYIVYEKLDESFDYNWNELL